MADVGLRQARQDRPAPQRLRTTDAGHHRKADDPRNVVRCLTSRCRDKARDQADARPPDKPGLSDAPGSRARADTCRRHHGLRCRAVRPGPGFVTGTAAVG